MGVETGMPSGNGRRSPACTSLVVMFLVVIKVFSRKGAKTQRRRKENVLEPGRLCVFASWREKAFSSTLTQIPLTTITQNCDDNRRLTQRRGHAPGGEDVRAGAGSNQ